MNARPIPAICIEHRRPKKQVGRLLHSSICSSHGILASAQDSFDFVLLDPILNPILSAAFWLIGLLFELSLFPSSLPKKPNSYCILKINFVHSKKFRNLFACSRAHLQTIILIETHSSVSASQSFFFLSKRRGAWLAEYEIVFPGTPC